MGGTTKASRTSAGAGINPFKELCGAKKTDGSGNTCGNLAGAGTDHEGVGTCKWHGGSTHAGKENAAAKMAKRVMAEYVGGYGVGELDIEPHEGILWCVRMTAHEIQYIAAECSKCAAEMVDEVESDPNHFASRKLQALVAERAKCMDRLAKYSKMALDAGVEERKVRIAEGYGEQIAMLLRAVFDDLDLSAAQRRLAPVIAQRRLLELEQGIISSTAEEITA